MTPAAILTLFAFVVGGLAMAAARLPVRKFLALLLLVLAVAFGLMRQLALALPLAAAAITLWRTERDRQRAAPSAGRISQVRTDWLAMTLDHDSGTMDGEILKGGFAGARLSALSTDDLRHLAREISASGDRDSLSLLDGYLVRHRAEEAETGDTGEAAPADGSAMSEAEALRILGLAPGASLQQVREAHHRLMRKVHPDSGGTTALAALINAARKRLDPS